MPRYNAAVMQRRRNLVSDSPLVEEMIEMLRLSGGSAPIADIADIILKLLDVETQLACELIRDLIKDDYRLHIDESATLKLTADENSERVKLTETDFVVVDLETTGPKTPPSRVMEIGAYRVSRGRIVAEFQTLVNPESPIPPFISKLTGITSEMVSRAPVFAEIITAWLDFAGEAVIVAHDAPFDVRFLNHEIARVFPGQRMANAHLCTVNLSRRVLPGLTNYRLHTLAEHFDIPLHNRHRAAADARATAELFIHLLARLDENGVEDLASARRFKARG